MKILIAIMTCHKNREKAAAQRATWVQDVRERHSADVVFFYGCPPARKTACPLEDEVFLDVDDSYFGIPDKVRAICRWAHERGYDYAAKCDDDVYVAPKRFPVLPLNGHDYVGRFRGPHGNFPAHFASGFFYWLSRTAMARVGYTQTKSTDWMDERYIANLLALDGIFGYNDPVNYKVTGPFTPSCTILQRRAIADGTVFCEYNAAQLHEMHKHLRDAEPVANHPGLRQVPEVNITIEQFEMKPVDRPPVHKIEKYMRTK